MQKTVDLLVMYGNYEYKTVNGIRRRIQRIKERIKTYQRYRGSKDNGTFWRDFKAVDKAILNMKQEINYFEKKIVDLTSDPALLQQLKQSEIF